MKEHLIKVVKTLSDQHVFEKQSTREPMYCFPDCPIAKHKGTVWMDQ